MEQKRKHKSKLQIIAKGTSFQRKIITDTQEPKGVRYQSPSLVMFAEGNIVFNAAGTFPENDGSTTRTASN